MNKSLPAPTWHIPRGQIVLGILWSLVVIAVQTLIIINYFANRNATANFSQFADITTTLANVQRQVLLLNIGTNQLLENPEIGYEAIEKQRAIIGSQLTVLKAQAAKNPTTLEYITTIQATLQEYDALIETLRDTPPAQFSENLATVDELFHRLESEQIKPAYDNAELAFFQSFSTGQKNQQNAQLLTISLGVLFFITSILLFVSLIRTSKRNFENAQKQLTILEEAVAERTKALETSAEVSRRLSSILDQHQLIIEIVEQVKSAFDYYHAHIYLLDEPTGDLIMTGGTGVVGHTMLARHHKVPKEKGLVGRAAMTNHPVLVPDTAQDPGWLPNPLLPETRSEVAVPISIGNRVLGVLDVQNNTVNGLKQADADLLLSIARQVAIGLENARTYTETHHRAEYDEMQTTINQKIQSAPSVELALEITAREIGRTFGLKETRVVLDTAMIGTPAQN